jgi:hypothetical protein
MKSKLMEAIELRKNNRPEEAIGILQVLLQSHPNDPDINYQMAWTCDFMGKESEAVPFYEKAIENGLREYRAGAMLGKLQRF